MNLTMKMAFKIIGSAALVFGFIISSMANSAFAIEIQEIKTKGGITAYLVENHTIPLIAMSFAFKGGAVQDEVKKEGTSLLLSATLDEGAGDIKSEAFQAKLDELGVELYFRTGLDEINGNFKTLTENKDEAFELLRLAVNEPRFDDEPVARLKSQLLVSLKNKEKNPNELTSEIWREKLMGAHPYGKPKDGTLESMSALTGDDLHEYRKRIFAKDNIYIGVVGAITAEELKLKLDEVFGEFSEKADLKPIAEKSLNAAGRFSSKLDVNQATIAMWLPGIKRNHPEFFSAYLMNHILGGGTFSSRLYKEVREKRGLTYGVGSYLATYDHMGLIGINVATRADKAEETLAVIRQEIKKMADNGPTQDELDKAKKFVAGSYAINNLDTSSKIARVLSALQSQGLGKGYIEDRQKLIKAVTLEKAQKIAKELLTKEPAIIIVGPNNYEEK